MDTILSIQELIQNISFQFPVIVRPKAWPWDQVREWAGATSGWAAFIAAIITTIYLARQLHQQKEQTNFILGNTDPSFIIERRKSNTVVLKVINWNRHNVVIENILYKNQKTNWKAFSNDGQKVYTNSRIIINGTTDRTKKSTIRNITLTDFDSAQKSNSEIRLKIKYRIIGQVQERKTAKPKALRID